VIDTPPEPGQPYLVLIGPPAAGKTRLGKRVARLLGASFVDTDRRIVAKHGPIAQIFSERGEHHYRVIERAEVAHALTERAVVALGGGAIIDPRTQADLAMQRVALITVSPDAVASRILGGGRPLINGVENWSELVASRREIYERLATRTWDTSHRPIDQIADEIAAWIVEDSASKQQETP
jgi:shikimate kinase